MKIWRIAVLVLLTVVSLTSIAARADSVAPQRATKSCPNGYILHGDVCVFSTTVCEGTGPAEIVAAICSVIVRGAKEITKGVTQ